MRTRSHACAILPLCRRQRSQTRTRPHARDSPSLLGQSLRHSSHPARAKPWPTTKRGPHSCLTRLPSPPVSRDPRGAQAAAAVGRGETRAGCAVGGAPPPREAQSHSGPSAVEGTKARRDQDLAAVPWSPCWIECCWWVWYRRRMDVPARRHAVSRRASRRRRQPRKPRATAWCPPARQPRRPTPRHPGRTSPTAGVAAAAVSAARWTAPWLGARLPRALPRWPAPWLGDGSGWIINATATSYIGASYVKFVEAAGTRLMPVVYNGPEEVSSRENFVQKMFSNNLQYSRRKLLKSV